MNPISDKPLLIVMTGPTASGKTSLAIEIAEKYGCDIISADSRQIYRDIPIGTAAPSPEERQRVFHHFTGILDLDAYYSAAKFEEDVMALLPRMWEKSPVAVMCGGSMMYVDAVVKGIDEMPTVSESMREYVLDLYRSHGLEGIRAQLEICDSEYYAQVDLDNPRRLIHALEICLQSGRPYSSFRSGSVRQRPFNVVKFAIAWKREDLFARINARVDLMMENGLMEEARRALARGPLNSLNTVGYKELAMYFSGEMDLPTAVARIGKNTRVYAKKQLTWLKRDPSVVWLDPYSTAPLLSQIPDFRVGEG